MRIFPRLPRRESLLQGRSEEEESLSSSELGNPRWGMRSQLQVKGIKICNQDLELSSVICGPQNSLAFIKTPILRPDR